MGHILIQTLQDPWSRQRVRSICPDCLKHLVRLIAVMACVFVNATDSHADPIPMKSVEASFHGGSEADLAHVIDDIESGPLGWSVAPKFTEPQSLVVRCDKPVQASELEITLFFLSGRPNGSIAEFDLAYTTDPEPALDGNWEAVVIQRYSAEMVNLSRLENGHLRSSGGSRSAYGLILDDTYRMVVQLPGGRATGFRLRAFPLSNAKGAPYAMSRSELRDFVLTEFRVEEHVRATTNVALHSAVTSSHPLFGSLSPSVLTDGQPATIAHPQATNLGADFQFDIDLGRTVTMDHIALLGRGDGWEDRLSRVLVRFYEGDPKSGAKPAWEGMDRADGSHPGLGERDIIRAGLGKGSFRGRFLRLSSDSPVPYSPQLAEVEVYEARTPEIVSVLADGREIPITDHLDLPPGVRRLSFRLRIPQIGMPVGNFFRWRVRGDLEKWQDSRMMTLEMPCPPPGRATFEAQAMHSDRELDASILSLPIIIRQHYWETSTFQVLVGAATLLGAVMLARVVTKRRAMRQLALANARAALLEERSRIASDLHDDLGANLARIGLLTEIARRSMDDPDQARLQLDKIYDTADDLSRQLRTVVWTVNPANDTLESFARYLHGHAEEYLGIAGIRCHFTSTETMPAMGLLPTMRHNLLLIAKEALHNIVKHAHATVVTFRMAVEDEQLVIEITDDGRGMPAPESMKPGNGLANMRSRVATIGGTCEILPVATGSGTRVRFVVPLDHYQNASCPSQNA